MEVSLASSFVVVAVPLRLRRRRSEKSEIIDVSRFSAREEAYGGGGGVWKEIANEVCKSRTTV